MNMVGAIFLTLFASLLLLSGSEAAAGKRMRLPGISDDVVADFATEYDHYLLTGKKTQKFQKLISAMKFTDEARQEAFLPVDERRSNLETGILCLGCRSAANYLLNKRRNENATDEFVKKLAKDICTQFEIMPEHVCEGLVNLNAPTLLYVVDNKQTLEADTICGMLLSDSQCPSENPELNWTIEIDKNRPAAPKPPSVTDPSLTFVQISDLHYDPNYKIGSTAVCKEPVCCRAKQGPAENPEEAAGKWGDYRSCDTPWEAIVDSYEQVKKQHQKIDAIYFTGDILDHGIWETTLEGNKKSIRDTMGKMKEVFGDVPVFPILGNHEPHPLNIYSPKNVPEAMNTKWLYDFVAEEWSYWLPEEARETMRYGGYYTILVKPGFRVIALNNNVAYSFNWWLFYDPVFIKEQLQWLHDTLLQAEKNKEKVHILAHIPPGTDSFTTWDKEFKRLVERFSDVISAQFNGHSHEDEFVVFYNMGSRHPKPINVAFNGGSITAYSYGNPNYKVYEVQPQTYNVLNHESWIYNLTAANLASDDSRPEWFKMYSFKDDFGIPSVSPANLDTLIKKMVKDEKLAYKYFEYKYKLGDLMLAKGCDRECQTHHVCTILTTVPGDHEMCRKYGAVWNK